MKRIFSNLFSLTFGISIGLNIYAIADIYVKNEAEKNNRYRRWKSYDDRRWRRYDEL